MTDINNEVVAFDDGSTGQRDACSRLTNKGVPLELAFVWPDYQIRCTADIDMFASQKLRFEKSVERIAAAGYQPESQPVVDMIKKHLQHPDPAFRYGAWLGYRSGQDCPKLYAEICPHLFLQQEEHLQIPDPCTVLQRGIKPVMFGWVPADGGYEVYYKASFLRPADIETLYAFYRLPSKAKEIKSLCERLLKKQIRTNFPMPDIGFSVSFSRSGVPEMFTLYAFAQSMLGMDHQIRHAILELGNEESWNMRGYEGLTQHLQIPGYNINTCHGMVGFASGLRGRLQFTVGVSPLMTAQLLAHAA